MDWLSDLLARQWADLLARPSGPYAFRFVLQPVMATIAGVGRTHGRPRGRRLPYRWAVLTGTDDRGNCSVKV